MLNDLLEKLSSLTGVAGDEFAASETVCGLLSEYMPNAAVDSFGTVTGSLEIDPGLPTLLLDAHIDEIGLAVTYIDDNCFVKAGKAGGVDMRILPAQSVTLWGKQPLKGVITTVPPHLRQNDGEKNKTLKDSEILIDTGYSSKDELLKILSLGDKITVDGKFTRLLNNRVCGKALDDRAGIACIIYAIELLKDKKDKLKYNVKVNFSSQEELGGRGSKIGSYNAEADYAIVVDVSYGNAPDCEASKTGKLGGGVMLGIAPSLYRPMFEVMRRIAAERDIPFQIEVMPGRTGTNACEISVSRKGVKCALLSIPERNMHMPVEALEISDIENTAKLIAAYLTEGEAC